MCEKNDFLKALMLCRGRKIIIHPAGSFTKYWNHISNFCFHLLLLGIYKHMSPFQVSYFFCLGDDFQKFWKEKESWVKKVICIMFIFSIAKAHILCCNKRYSHSEKRPNQVDFWEEVKVFPKSLQILFWWPIYCKA